VINRFLFDRFSRLFDPYQEADGAPPAKMTAFYRWALRGAGHVIFAQGLVSALVALAEVLSAWLIGRVVDQAGNTPKELFFEQHSGLLIGALILFLVCRPLLMSVQAGLNSLSLQPGLFHLVLNAITFAVALTIAAVVALGQANWRLGLVLLLWIGLYMVVLKIMLPQVRLAIWPPSSSSPTVSESWPQPKITLPCGALRCCVWG